MIVRRTEDGAWKWAFRDFLREECRAIQKSVSTDRCSINVRVRTGVYLRHFGGALYTGGWEELVCLRWMLGSAACVPRLETFSEIAGLNHFRMCTSVILDIGRNSCRCRR